MRRSLFALLAAWLALASLGRPAQAGERIELRGKHISFFSDRLLLVAQATAIDVPGRVRLRADEIRYDLRNDRVLAAGHVHVVMHGRPLEALAFAIDLHSGTAYALLTDPLPDSLKIVHERLSGAVHEAPPADIFVLSDVNGLRPWIRGTHASVTENVGVTFAPAQFPTGSGITVPSPRYLFVFASNPNYANNTLPGAAFDQPYALATGPHFADLAHFRFDAQHGATLAFDHHLVFGENTYAIASIAPVNRAAKVAALTFSQKLGTKINQTLTTSLSWFNTGFNQPLSAAQSTNYRISKALRHSYAQLSLTQSNNSLLPPPPNGQYWGDAGHGWDPRHPFSADLQWNGYDVRLHNGFAFHLSSAFGYDHDAQGVIPLANDPVPYHTIWHHGVGLFVQSPLFKYRDATFGATIEQDEKWYSYPHRVDQTSLRATVSRRLNKTINLVGTFDLQNQLDDYHARQFVFFKPPALPYLASDGTPWPGYLAYAGATTQRDYRLDAYYTPSGYFNFTTSFQYTHDFPQFHGFGRQPYSASFDIRARPFPNLGVEIGRSYYFNWNKQGWSPQWTFAVSP